MERLPRYDVAEFDGISMVVVVVVIVVENELLPPDLAVVVMPLLSDYPAVQGLNPEILHDGKRFILATRPIAALRRSALRRSGSVADQSDHITRAIDVLMGVVQSLISPLSRWG